MRIASKRLVFPSNWRCVLALCGCFSTQLFPFHVSKLALSLVVSHKCSFSLKANHRLTQMSLSPLFAEVVNTWQTCADVSYLCVNLEWDFHSQRSFFSVGGDTVLPQHFLTDWGTSDYLYFWELFSPFFFLTPSHVTNTVPITLLVAKCSNGYFVSREHFFLPNLPGSQPKSSAISFWHQILAFCFFTLNL